MTRITFTGGPLDGHIDRLPHLPVYIRAVTDSRSIHLYQLSLMSRLVALVTRRPVRYRYLRGVRV